MQRMNQNISTRITMLFAKTRNSFLLLALVSFLFTGLTGFHTKPITGLAEDLLAETNEFRRQSNLPELELSDELSAIAQKHSENMATARVGFGHGGFSKRSAQARKQLDDVISVAEDVAYGPTSASELMQLWKNSTGHRRNMLGKYKYVGIGIAKNRRGILYYTMLLAG